MLQNSKHALAELRLGHHLSCVYGIVVVVAFDILKHAFSHGLSQNFIQFVVGLIYSKAHFFFSKGSTPLCFTVTLFTVFIEQFYSFHLRIITKFCAVKSLVTNETTLLTIVFGSTSNGKDYDAKVISVNTKHLIVVLNT